MLATYPVPVLTVTNLWLTFRYMPSFIFHVLVSVSVKKSPQVFLDPTFQVYKIFLQFDWSCLYEVANCNR